MADDPQRWKEKALRNADRIPGTAVAFALLYLGEQVRRIADVLEQEQERQWEERQG